MMHLFHSSQIIRRFWRKTMSGAGVARAIAFIDDSKELFPEIEITQGAKRPA
jgi:hypothetical protein